MVEIGGKVMETGPIYGGNPSETHLFSANYRGLHSLKLTASSPLKKSKSSQKDMSSEPTHQFPGAKPASFPCIETTNPSKPTHESITIALVGCHCWLSCGTWHSGGRFR